MEHGLKTMTERPALAPLLSLTFYTRVFYSVLLRLPKPLLRAATLLQPDWNEPESTRQGGVRDDRRYSQENPLAGHTRMEWSELVQTRKEIR
jgi:hypothetical protein